MANKSFQATLYINGKVLTMDENETIAEAVLTINDKIIAVGKTEELMEYNFPFEDIIDLEGKVMMPGLIDGHIHLETSMTDVILGGQASTPPCESVDDILKVIKETADSTPLDEWVVVRGTIGYDKKIKERRNINKDDIDSIVNTHPVAFFPAVHTCILNTKGIRKMGWTHEKNMPINGTLGRNQKNGELTGIFCEVMETAPLSPWGYKDRKDALLEGTMKYFLARGVTSVHENPYSFDGISIWQELNREGKMPVRVRLFLPDIYLLHGAKDFLQYGFSRGFGDNWLCIGGIKFFADGTNIHANGHPIKCLHYTQEELDSLIYESHKAGWQVWTHAMSEEGFLQTLVAYERALQRFPKQDHRMRIEHSGDIIGNFKKCDEYIQRMKKAGIGAMCTPQFQYFSAYYNPNSRIHTKGLIDKGFKLPGNSDSTGSVPAAFNPWFSIWCAVTRKNYLGEVVGPNEKISVMEALKMFTCWAAWGAFEDKIKGSIEPGKLADMIILGDDPLTCDSDALKEMPVETVIIGGEIKYQA